MSAQICPLMHLAIGANLLEQQASGECTREVAKNALDAVELVTKLVKADIELQDAQSSLRKALQLRLDTEEKRQRRARVSLAANRRSDLLACFKGGAA